MREAARIQSFPDNFFFEGSRTSIFKQIGNAVPPMFAQQIAKAVKNGFKVNFVPQTLVCEVVDCYNTNILQTEVCDT